MKVEIVFAGLPYARGIAALPQADVVKWAPDGTQAFSILPTPTGPIEGTPPNSDDDSSEPEECLDLPFGGAGEAANTWEESGAGDFLLKYLEENGVEGWADNLLSNTVAGGSSGGDTFDCETIGSGSCGLPEDRSLSSYDPCEAFYIHQSIGNLHEAFGSILSALNDEALVALGKTTKDIQTKFGNGGDDGLWAILIGIFVGAAAAAGPFWQIGAQMTAIVGALNIAAGADAMTQPDVGGDLEYAVIEFYTKFRDTFKGIASALMAGDFDVVDDDGDPTGHIYDAVSEGKMLVKDDRIAAVDGFLDKFRTLLEHMLIFKCLAASEWNLFIFNDNEENCEKTTRGTGQWISVGDVEGCAALGYFQPLGPLPHAMMDEERFNALKGYGVDLQEAFTSIVECDGGEYQAEPIQGADYGSLYPPCMLSMRVIGP